jgi:hypothetical protein
VLKTEHLIYNGPYQFTAPVRAPDPLSNARRQQTEEPTQEDREYRFKLFQVFHNHLESWGIRRRILEMKEPRPAPN